MKSNEETDEPEEGQSPGQLRPEGWEVSVKVPVEVVRVVWRIEVGREEVMERE